MRRPLSERGNGRYDVTVVGSGHNGLISAAYLAKAGKRVQALGQRMAWTRSANCSLLILDHGLFVSVPKTVEGRLIEVPSDELQPYRKPGGGGPTRYREARMARQVGRSCIAG
jgi:choline dehydrogenase-like flavoprotein